jgi:hypothetical protein
LCLPISLGFIGCRVTDELPRLADAASERVEFEPPLFGLDELRVDRGQFVV